MSKSKIENRLNTMRHKQAQPTDSLILAESAEGKDFSQELSKAQPFDEIPSLTEKQVAFGMCNPQAHLDAKQEKLERFKKKRAEKKLALAIDKSSFPNPTEDYDARSVAAPNNPSFEELLEIGMKLQNQPAPPSPEEPIVKKGPKTQSLVGMTRELQKKVSIISYHGALYFFNGRYYEYLDTDRLLMLYREYVDYDLNHESSLYGHKDLYQCCATDPEIQREEPKGEPIYAPLKNGIFVLGEEKLYPHSPDQLTFTCIKAKYDPQAKCPVFDRFLWQITHGNPQLLERFWMAIGYLFIYPARGKFFILMGYARDSGKSVLGNFIQRLYPKESVSNLRLSEMKGTFALICYNKSHSDGYLTQKRVKNLDESSYVYVKGDFEPLVSEEMWDRCQQILLARSARVIDENGKKHKYMRNTPKSVWTAKLRCSCGAGFIQFKWRVNRDGAVVHGFQCYRRTRRPSISYLQEHGLDLGISCQIKAISEWKLDLMASKVFQNLTFDKGKTVKEVYRILNRCMAEEKTVRISRKAMLENSIAKQKERLDRYIDLCADGVITKQELMERRKGLDEQIAELQSQYESIEQEDERSGSIDMKLISQKLDEWQKAAKTDVSRELINSCVAQITPVSNEEFRWVLDFQLSEVKGINMTSCTMDGFMELARFVIPFEDAKAFKASRNQKIHRRDWTDLTVVVGIRSKIHP